MKVSRSVAARAASFFVKHKKRNELRLMLKFLLVMLNKKLCARQKSRQHHERSCYLHDVVVTFVSARHSHIEFVLRIRRGG